MAVGLGRMMGFEYLRNFNYPYVAGSVAEFWRRWHMSLYAFFRDYLYIPLGGSRVPAGRWVANTAAVWLVTGLWHGAAWHYVLWGAYYGVLLVCERLVWGEALSRAPAAARHAYSVALFVLGWLVFWAPEAELPGFLAAMAGAYGPTGSSTMWELGVWEYWPVFLACAAASAPVAPWAWERFRAWAEMRRPRRVTDPGQPANARTLGGAGLCAMECSPATPARARAAAAAEVAVDAALLGLLVLSCASVLAGSYNPFIYFQF